MENYIKPDWLIEAEEAIKEFEQTEWGSLTQKEFNKKMGSIKGGKTNVYSGHFKKFTKEGGKAQGKIQGKKNVESGHLDRIRTRDGSIKGGKKAGKKNVESGHIQNLGKIYGKEAVESGRIFKLAKEQAKKLRKLTFEQAQEIRSLYKSGLHKQKDLAEIFGCTKKCINLIVNNKRYLEP